MTEEYLHYLFQNGLLGNSFQTSRGKTLDIIDFGELNSDAGPDFLDAQIRIDDKIWAGPIEFHIKASDWYKHGHQNDPAYQNVIAHFVYQLDMEIHLGQFKVPSVELKNQVDENQYNVYRNMLASKLWIPCANQLSGLNQSALEEEKEKRIRDRLWRKSIQIISDIEEQNGDIQKAVLLSLARIMGGKPNSIPFERLVSNLNLRWLAKLNYDPFRVEALLFGMANLLPDSSNDLYVHGLIREYNYLKNLFGITDNEPYGWKYSRMRPYNFPDIRIAQFAQLLCKSRGGFVNNSIQDMKTLFEIEMHPFWQTHFRLCNITEPKASNITDKMIDLILINVWVPFKYGMGVWKGSQQMQNEAITALKELKSEKNQIISKWKTHQVQVKTAFDSQSLLELKKEGCNRKKCLFCAFGKSILKR